MPVFCDSHFAGWPPRTVSRTGGCCSAPTNSFPIAPATAIISSDRAWASASAVRLINTINAGSPSFNRRNCSAAPRRAAASKIDGSVGYPAFNTISTCEYPVAAQNSTASDNASDFIPYKLNPGVSPSATAPELPPRTPATAAHAAPPNTVPSTCRRRITILPPAPSCPRPSTLSSPPSTHSSPGSSN